MDIYLAVYILLVIQQIIGFFSKSYYLSVSISNKIYLQRTNLFNIGMMFFVSAILFFIAILRSDVVGTDYGQYLYFMDVVQSYRWSDIYSVAQGGHIEYFFLLISKFISVFTTDRYLMMGFWYLTLFVCLAMFLVKGSKRYYIGLYIFFTLGLFNQSLNITRQYVAASILGLGLIYFINNNVKKYLFSLIIAIFIHNSAILGLLLILLKFKNIKKNIRIITLVGILVSLYLTFNFSAVFSALGLENGDIDYARYVISESYEGGMGFGLLINLFIYTVYFIFYKQFTRFDNSAYMWLTCAALTLALNLISINTFIIARLLIYFKIVILISVPRFIDSCIRNRNVKYITYGGLIGVCGIYYMYILVNTSLYNTVPYIFR
ncbi:EpsG family protein [Veillonella magna]|uniref:EpsG family protein n=1 Tax=Veillonella magna TaxID=464322 RepID=UPI0023F2F0D3|nr:EpsG family protein [Veillonella magna]MBD8976829.1 EpsG family protein [Veillonella magna]